MYRLFINEFSKIRRTAVYYIILAGVCLIPIVFFIAFLSKTAHFTPPAGINPWPSQIMRVYESISFMLIPTYLVLVTALYMNIEHRAKAWKQLLVYPNSKASLYFTKLGIIIILTIATYVLFIVATLLFSSLAAIFKPQLGFLNFAPLWLPMFKLTLKSFIGTLAILGLQFWLSTVMKNFIWPISIGIGLTIAGLIILRWEYSMYIPYLQPYHAQHDFSGAQYAHIGHLSLPELTSLAGFAIFSLFGFLHFRKLSW